MPYYDSMSKKAVDIAARYGKKLNITDASEVNPVYRITAFSNPQCWVVTNEPDLKLMFWGLIPFWVQAKNGSEPARKAAVIEAEKIRKGTYNAKAETIWVKRSYWKPIKKQRCIIPLTGFFEYNHIDEKITVPYYIFPTDDDFFSIGGIWDSWLDPETGDMLYTFSQITTEANPMMRKIHNAGKNPFRQPFILNREDEKRWLDPELPKEEIQKLLKPFDEKYMDTYAVNNDFLKKDKYDPSILEAREIF